jgi:hypothetical protein
MVTNPTFDAVMLKVQAFLVAIAAPANLQVIRGPVNRAAQPVGDHIIYTPIMRNRLRTNVHEDNPTTQQTTIEEGSKTFVQFDFYGLGAADLSAIAEMLWRDQFACDILSPEAKPLYTDTANMVPLVTGEDQFLERFTLTAVLQWNVRTTVTQQSATTLEFGLVNVDERFPPV